MNEESIDYDGKTESKRPTLLTVLCILTWVVSAYYIFTVPFEYFFSSGMDPGQLQSTINDAMTSMAEEDPEAAEFMEGFMKAASDMIAKSLENAGWIASFEILVTLLSAFGAYLMFSLRKSGFWIYTFAKVLGILTVLIFMGVNILTVSVASFALFVGLIMIALYAVNLKHMH